MKCPLCYGKTLVISGRLNSTYFYRQRQCQRCQFRFATKQPIKYGKKLVEGQYEPVRRTSD